MTLVTCLHPNCTLSLLRNRVCCKRHWFQLPEDLRQQINKASRADPSVLGALKIEATEYFESRLIGDHEIVTCRGKDCDADIVWLLTAKGKNMPVNADTIRADDDRFEYGRHIVHWADCPNVADFRKGSSRKDAATHHISDASA